MSWSRFIFVGHSARELALNVCNDEQSDIFLHYGPAQEQVLAISITGKTRKRFGKNAGEWTGRVKISKEEIPGTRRTF